jgi:class 3 adenylate cyclase
MRQERKVVTVLFCDLVGFTSRAEELDPEDVANVLAPYHSRVRTELERFGGTVEKFIGDAVMAVFGVPSAHEDDAERAVRAALAIHDFAVADEIELRIGITTGEALVDVDARPEAGETMATGDVVNTAARLQAAAPVNGVLVSERTHLATKDAISYRAVTPVEVKGKARPVEVWEAVAAAPLAERSHTSPLVGRANELDLLRATIARTSQERMTQLVTLVGAPGIGKSRLVHELVRGNGGVAWRKGRCLPYGDGVTFWALGEVVKSQLGILESDDPDEVARKLEDGVSDPWIAENLRPLLGLAEAPTLGRGGRSEAFAAWRQFLAGLA